MSGISRTGNGRRQTLQQANLVVENSPVVIFRWEAKEGWPVAFVSRNITQFGYTPEELMSGTVPFSAIVHPEDLERVAREVQTYSSQGPDEYQQEYRILTRDGDVRWIDDRTVIERDPEGRITHYQGIVIDITERKRAEAELKKNNNFTRALLDAVPTPVFYKDRDGRYIGCNRAFTDIMGVSSDQLAGKTVFELWPSELSETYHRKDIELMEHPQHQIYEFSVRDREGTVRPVIYAKDVFFDGAGQVAGIVGAFLDISGLKQAEQALRESEVKFRELTELLPQIVFETDTDMMLTFVNRQAYSALGYTPDEVKAGINALSCIDPSQHDLIRDKYQETDQKGAL